MIYALGLTVLACFLVTIALIAYVWTLKQASDIQNREVERKDTINHGSFANLNTLYASLNERLQRFEVRPEAPAVEQYRKVLGELEDFGHIVRSLEHKMQETLESVRRTQNKLAARSKRPADPDIEAQIEAITATGDEQVPEALPRRQFGQVRK